MNKIRLLISAARLEPWDNPKAFRMLCAICWRAAVSVSAILSYSFTLYVSWTEFLPEVRASSSQQSMIALVILCLIFTAVFGTLAVWSVRKISKILNSSSLRWHVLSICTDRSAPPALARMANKVFPSML